MEDQDVAPAPAPAAAADPPSPSHSYDDIEALAAWPALEQFMEDLSDLDEQGNAPERPEQPPKEVRDPLGGRDLGLSKALFGSSSSYAQRGLQLPLTQQLLPTSHYMPWQTLNLPFNRGGGSTNSLSSVPSGDRPMHRSDSLHSLGGGCSSCAASSSSHTLQPQVPSADALGPSCLTLSLLKPLSEDVTIARRSWHGLAPCRWRVAGP